MHTFTEGISIVLLATEDFGDVMIHHATMILSQQRVNFRIP
ncbi:hypothetical protein [Chryseobacterium sp. FH1]|nr:hypothetical protein [Chryseobacterium sp. FH1]